MLTYFHICPNKGRGGVHHPVSIAPHFDAEHRRRIARVTKSSKAAQSEHKEHKEHKKEVRIGAACKKNDCSNCYVLQCEHGCHGQQETYMSRTEFRSWVREY